MARVSTYNTDTDVSGNDKVLGSDISGATKNYPLKKIGQYFAQQNVVTVPGQLGFRSILQPSGRVKGDFWINDGENDGEQLSNITKFVISKHQFEDDVNVSSMLNKIMETKFLFSEVGNPNVHGEFTVTSKFDYADDDEFLQVVVTAVNTNGAISLEEYYVFSLMGQATAGDKKYSHVQGSAASTWTVDHNLNKKPAVSVVDSLENLIICEVEYTSLNQVVLRFDTTYSGKAYFN